MIPEAVFAMLACARLGVIHSVVFGGFASKELSSRVIDSSPKCKYVSFTLIVIITASCGIEPNKLIPYKKILDEALAIAEMKNIKRLIVQRHNEHYEMDLDPELYFDYHTLMANTKDVHPCVHLPTDHPLYILCKLFFIIKQIHLELLEPLKVLSEILVELALALITS